MGNTSFIEYQETTKKSRVCMKVYLLCCWQRYPHPSVQPGDAKCAGCFFGKIDRSRVRAPARVIFCKFKKSHQITMHDLHRLVEAMQKKKLILKQIYFLAPQQFWIVCRLQNV